MKCQVRFPAAAGDFGCTVQETKDCFVINIHQYIDISIDVIDSHILRCTTNVLQLVIFWGVHAVLAREYHKHVKVIKQPCNGFHCYSYRSGQYFILLRYDTSLLDIIRRTNDRGL